jgi:hypothetical protein
MISNKRTFSRLVLLVALFLPARADELIVDAESFADIGGWVVDQQLREELMTILRTTNIPEGFRIGSKS